MAHQFCSSDDQVSPEQPNDSCTYKINMKFDQEALNFHYCAVKESTNTVCKNY